MSCNAGMARYFRQVCRGRIYASRAVYPLYRIIGLAATGGIYAAPTNNPVNSGYRYVAGGAYPAPTAQCFLFSPHHLTFLHFDFTNFTILLQERGFFCKSFTAIVHAHGRSGAETALQ